MSLTANLPTDPLGYRFAGPAGYLPSGTRVGSTDYAYTHVQLYKADGTVLIGQQAMATSLPVVFASDQSALPIAKTVLTASSPAAATVGTSSAEAVAVNTSRKGLILVNTSANTISLAFGVAAVLNSGITLLPGASYTMGQFDFTTAQVRAIASAASSNLAIQEFV